MEFNTASIWGIIIFLILVTIFIVIWYSYKEIIYCKRRIEDIVSSKEQEEHETTENGDQEEQFEAFFEEPEIFEQEEYQELFEPIQEEHPETIQEDQVECQEHLETIQEEPQELEPIKPKKKTRNTKRFSIEQL